MHAIESTWSAVGGGGVNAKCAGAQETLPHTHTHTHTSGYAWAVQMFQCSRLGGAWLLGLAVTGHFAIVQGKAIQPMATDARCVCQQRAYGRIAKVQRMGSNAAELLTAMWCATRCRRHCATAVQHVQSQQSEGWTSSSEACTDPIQGMFFTMPGCGWCRLCATNLQRLAECGRHTLCMTQCMTVHTLHSSSSSSKHCPCHCSYKHSHALTRLPYRRQHLPGQATMLTL